MDKIELLVERDLLKEKIEQLEKEKAELEHEKSFQDNLILSLRDDVIRLEQQLQGLTPEMIKRYKLGVEGINEICHVCDNVNTKDWDCTINRYKNFNFCEGADFIFFNDSEGENE